MYMYIEIKYLRHCCSDNYYQNKDPNELLFFYVSVLLLGLQTSGIRGTGLHCPPSLSGLQIYRESVTPGWWMQGIKVQ